MSTTLNSQYGSFVDTSNSLINQYGEATDPYGTYLYDPFSPSSTGAILIESGYFLLQEDGSPILI